MLDRPLVFVVDDDAAITTLVKIRVQAAGYTVETFSKPDDCMVAIKQRAPSAILLDRHLGGADGLDLLAPLHRLLPQVPIILLTSDNQTATVVQAMKGGAFDFLVKPIDTVRLNDVLKSAIEKHALTTKLDELELEVKGGSFSNIVGQSPAMLELFRQMQRVSATDVSVYLRGESGTGKELVARALHERSGRKNGPLVCVNCGAIAESMQEGELFGWEKGAFTGSVGKHEGMFERADGGTLFLDEVAELSLSLQTKLLRVLQERALVRVGGRETIRSDFRLIIATHRDLAAEVKAGRFREDLYYRIVVYEIMVPALRDREGDLRPLVRFMLSELGPELTGSIPDVSPQAMQALEAHTWSGNVRELQNAMQRALVSCDGVLIRRRDLPRTVAEPTIEPDTEHGVFSDKEVTAIVEQPGAASATEQISAPAGATVTLIDPRGGEWFTLESIERQVIDAALRAHDGNRQVVADKLGIGRTTLYRKLKEAEPTP